MEERVGLRQIDHSVDASHHRRQSRAIHRHGVADADVKIRRRLLRDQDAVRAPEHLPHLAGKVGPVGRRDAEHLAFARRLRRAAIAGGETRHVRVTDSVHGPYADSVPKPLLDCGRTCTVHNLDLPVHRHIAQRSLRHCRRAGIDENAQDHEERDCEADAQGCRQHAARAAARQTSEPDGARAHCSAP